MLSLVPAGRLFLARDPVDCRKSFDGLAQVVRDVFGDDPFSGSAFFFFNRRRNRLKILLWDENGFVVLAKRLERGTFGVLDVEGERSASRVEIDRAELAMLLEGIDRKSAKFRKHFVRRIRLMKRSG